MFLRYIANKIYLEATDSIKEEFLHPEIFSIKRHINLREEHASVPLVLLLTNKCNAICTYCYVNANKTKKIMSFKLAKKVIDAALIKNSKLDIYFFGGGEPTIAFALMKKIQVYTSSFKNKQINLFLISNGFFNKSVAKWIASNIKHISISCDGPPYIQNKNRPLIGKQDSSSILEENLNFLLQKGASVVLRVTITMNSSKKQKEIIEYAFRLGIKKLLFAPFRTTNKSRKNKVKAVNYFKFAQDFLKANELADIFGSKIISDFFPIEPKDSMCGFESPNIAVSYSGHVTTCWESSISYTDKRDEFVYGRIGDNGEIRKNPRSWDKITKRTPDNIDECRSCFLKRSCAGGCAATHFQATGDIMKLDKNRCDASRWLVKQYILCLARQQNINIKPFFEQNQNKTYFITYFNRFRVGRKNIMEFNPFIEISKSNLDDLSLLTKLIVKYRDKKGYSPILFFLNFIFSPDNLNINTGHKIITFLKTLSDHKIHFIITAPLPSCIFSTEDLSFIITNYKSPETLITSLSFFRIINNFYYFNNINSKIKYSALVKREILFKRALEIKPFQIYNKCCKCPLFLQKSCGGVFNKININIEKKY